MGILEIGIGKRWVGRLAARVKSDSVVGTGLIGALKGTNHYA